MVQRKRSGRNNGYESLLRYQFSSIEQAKENVAFLKKTDSLSGSEKYYRIIEVCEYIVGE